MSAKQDAEKGPSWFLALSKGEAILEGVKEASQDASFGLKGAAGGTKVMIDKIQGIRDNHANLQDIVEHTAKLLVAIYEKYKEQQREWDEDQQGSVKDFETTETEIRGIVEDRSQKAGVLQRFAHNVRYKKRVAKHQNTLFNIAKRLQLHIETLDDRETEQDTSNQETPKGNADAASGSQAASNPMTAEGEPNTSTKPMQKMPDAFFSNAITVELSTGPKPDLETPIEGVNYLGNFDPLMQRTSSFADSITQDHVETGGQRDNVTELDPFIEIEGPLGEPLAQWTASVTGGGQSARNQAKPSGSSEAIAEQSR